MHLEDVSVRYGLLLEAFCRASESHVNELMKQVCLRPGHDYFPLSEALSIHNLILLCLFSLFFPSFLFLCLYIHI